MIMFLIVTICAFIFIIASIIISIIAFDKRYKLATYKGEIIGPKGPTGLDGDRGNPGNVGPIGPDGDLGFSTLISNTLVRNVDMSRLCLYKEKYGSIINSIADIDDIGAGTVNCPDGSSKYVIVTTYCTNIGNSNSREDTYINSIRNNENVPVQVILAKNIYKIRYLIESNGSLIWSSWVDY